MEAVGQDVELEAADELVGVEGHDLWLVSASCRENATVWRLIFS
jgi:hypothetical protein